MGIKTAKYMSDRGIDTSIFVVYQDDKILSVPITSDNTDYTEIIRQVDAGELTIEPADE